MLAYEQIVAIAKKMPDKIAIYGTGQVYSYGWLDQCSNRVACALLEQGVKQNELIALCFSRSVDYVVTLLAVHKIGCAFLPLNTDQPVSRINTIVELAGVKYVVKNDDSIQLDQVNVLDYAALSSQRLADESVFSCITVAPENLAYVIFTSGSTGLPKGVKIKHSSLACLVQHMREVIGIDDADCLFAQAAFHFDMSIADLYWPLTSGASIYLPTKDELRNPKKTIDLLNSENITL
ncbi:MAG TPA: AMP-binding protein, partial [Pseudomonadales bacterium]|nr:AMP-binding protein [Pseudomonadales bacterium]